MHWLFADSRQILKFKDPRCYSRYFGAGREPFAVMDTHNSAFTDTEYDLLAPFCSNLSSLSLTVLRCFTKVLLSSIPQALKHRWLIPASWQARFPAPCPVYSSKPTWCHTCCPSLLPSSSSLSFPSPYNFISPLFSTSLSPAKCLLSLHVLQILKNFII